LVRYLALLLLASVAGLLTAADVPPALNTQIDGIIAKALAGSKAPSISVAVVQHGKLIYAKAHGHASLSPSRDATTDTRYAVGSISKQFTAAAILLAAEQGKISLDDKVSKYFPNLTRADEVAIRELLSHTSGYEDYAPQDYIIPEWIRSIAPDRILDIWARKPLNFDPGTRWQYSNTNYVLAGRIFEKATRQALMPFLQEQIFRPLGMRATGDCNADKQPGDAVAYTRYALGPPREARREGAGWYFAAGELCTTPSDVARWDVALLRKKILDSAAYGRFTQEVKLKNGAPTHYGLGVELGDLEGVPMIYHGGEVSGFLAVNRVFPTEDAAVIVCSNQDGTGVIFSVSRQISQLLVAPGSKPSSPEEIRQVTGILEGLAHKKIDRSLFTGDANSYFSATALNDYGKSLAPLGKLKTVTRTSENLRGGMTHRAYRAEFEKKTLNLNVYVTVEGKYEQFLVVEQF
jgi:D-alanyl-D-alanine carboxypeptidase